LSKPSQHQQRFAGIVVYCRKTFWQFSCALAECGTKVISFRVCIPATTAIVCSLIVGISSLDSLGIVFFFAGWHYPQIGCPCKRIQVYHPRLADTAISFYNHAQRLPEATVVESLPVFKFVSGCQVLSTLTIVFVSITWCGAQNSTEQIAIRVDADRVQGAMPPVWNYFGYEVMTSPTTPTLRMRRHCSAR
jgi:hypothetical protein